MDEEKISELKTDMKESFRMQHKKTKKKQKEKGRNK